MSTLPDAYWHEIRGRYERLPVWLPGTPMNLGDVGTFHKRRWTKLTSLAALGVEAAPDVEGSLGNLDHSSHDGVHRTAGLTRSGVDTAVATAAGNVHYRFQREGAFVLHTRDATVHRLADLTAVETAVRALYEKKEWRREWVVITEVLVGGPSLVLVSAGRSAEAGVRLRAEAAVDPTTAVALAPSFVVESQQGLAASLDSPSRTALMWRGHMVRDPWVGKPKMVERGEDTTADVTPGAGEPGRPYWAEVEYPEDLDLDEIASP